MVCFLKLLHGAIMLDTKYGMGCGWLTNWWEKPLDDFQLWRFEQNHLIFMTKSKKNWNNAFLMISRDNIFYCFSDRHLWRDSKVENSSAVCDQRAQTALPQEDSLKTFWRVADDIFMGELLAFCSLSWAYHAGSLKTHYWNSNNIYLHNRKDLPLPLQYAALHRSARPAGHM